MTGRRIIVAIDGPSGAGKGTVARALARALGYRHVDTGAMYRAVAWLAVERSLSLSDASAIARVAAEARFDLDDRVLINGHDVTSAIRTAEMDRAAATVARHPEVRRVLVDRQRSFGAGGGLVMEGRDIGTVVFPDADVKIFLDASPEERARRRANDQAHADGRGAAAVDRVAENLAARDQSDTTRLVSPLTQARDAAYIDTTGVAIDEVVRRALDIVTGTLTAPGTTH